MTAKSALRKAVLAARAKIGPAERARAAEALRSALSPHLGTPIAGYHPMRGEADPLPALTLAAAYGAVGLPVIEARAQPLRFRSWSPDSPMEQGAFSAMVPKTGPWMVPRIIVVPLVAFDARGGRLGYGGGFYDRTLEQLRAQHDVLAMGFAFSAQQIDAVPLEPTDQPLDLIVTETGILDLR